MYVDKKYQILGLKRIILPKKTSIALMLCVRGHNYFDIVYNAATVKTVRE